MWKLFYLPFTVIFYLILPFVVFIDTIFRDSDILFVHPEKLKQAAKNKERKSFTNFGYQNDGTGDLEAVKVSEGGENIQLEHWIFSYFRSRIHRPILRIIAYHYIEILFLVSLSLTLLDPMGGRGEKVIQFYDYVTFGKVKTTVDFLPLKILIFYYLLTFWPLS